MLCLICTAASARATLIDFDGLLDLEPVSIQHPGAVFENAVALATRISLVEVEFRCIREA